MSCSLETFHQKLNVPGPDTVVSKYDSPFTGTAPLTAASSKSCVTSAWQPHGTRPVTKVRFVTSNASASEHTPSTRTVLLPKFAVNAVGGKPASQSERATGPSHTHTVV